MNPLTGLMLIALLAVASWSDLVSRRIPNAVPAALAMLWVVTSLTEPFGHAPLGSVAGAAAVLTVGILAWRAGGIGGGDVKLLASLSLWAGPEFLVPFLLVTSLAGGALAAALLWYRRFGFVLTATAMTALRNALALLTAGRTGDGAWACVPPPPATLPYGLAIAAGGGWLVHQLIIA